MPVTSDAVSNIHATKVSIFLLECKNWKALSRITTRPVTYDWVAFGGLNTAAAFSHIYGKGGRGFI